MKPRACPWPVLSIALAAGVLAGCAYEPLPPVSLPAPKTASSEELRWAVEAGLAAHRWVVTERGPGSISAYVYSQGSGDHASVEIEYVPGRITINCVKRQVSKQRYDRWMQLLTSEIQKSVAQLGMGRRPPPSEP